MANVVPARLVEAMDELGFDQSSLARAVGCTPGAINQIVSGNVRRSRFAPEIAFQLGVSYDWLTGQSETKYLPGRSNAVIAADERALVDDLRELRSQDRNALFRIASALRLAGQKQDGVDLPPEPALAQMFEALLEILDSLPDKPSLEERARLLAQWLPTGLLQLRDLLPDQAVAPVPEIRRELAEALATSDHGSRS